MAKLSQFDELGTVGTESGQDRLVFPINVHESLQASGGLRKGEKVGIVISFWLFGCGILAWFLLSWLRTIIPGQYVLVTILIEVVLQLTVGVYILRFVMDERAVFAEMHTQDTSFATYFKIYRDIKASDNSHYPFDVLEFDDGSFGVFVQCRLGFNTQQRSDNTYHSNRAVINILNKAGLPRSTFYHNENFKSSQAAQHLRDIVAGIKDPKLFTVYRDMVQNYLNIAENESNVLCVTHIIYAQTRIQKDELLATMNAVFLEFERDDTVYRQVSALQYDDIVEFLRHYYRLEVLDMGLIRAHIALKKNQFNCPVHVLKIYGASGKVYTSGEFQKLSKELIAEQGLTSVN